MAVQPEDIRLLANSRFRRLMEARAVAQTGQNAMLYTLLILVVNETASSIHSTLLITAWMLPCIVLGVPAGGLAGVLPTRALLVAGYALPGAAAGERAGGGGGPAGSGEARPARRGQLLDGALADGGAGGGSSGTGALHPQVHQRRDVPGDRRPASGR